MTGRPGHRTMETIGGSSARHLARTPCVPLFCTSFNRGGNRGAFRLQGAGGGSFPLYGGTFAQSYSASNDFFCVCRCGKYLHALINGICCLSCVRRHLGTCGDRGHLIEGMRSVHSDSFLPGHELWTARRDVGVIDLPARGEIQKSLGVHKILVRKIWFYPPPRKGPKMRKNCTNQQKILKLDTFGRGGERKFMDKTILWTSGCF